jgi:hypothetical protein
MFGLIIIERYGKKLVKKKRRFLLYFWEQWEEGLKQPALKAVKVYVEAALYS